MTLIKTEFDVKTGYAEIPDTAIFLQTIRDIGLKRESRIVCLDADQLAGLSHVISAVTHAMRAWAEGSNITDSIEMEILCYAAGNRQCNVSRMFGIHRGMNRLFIVILPPVKRVLTDLKRIVTFSDENWDELPLEKRQWLMELFHITSLEIAAVGEERFRDLVLERVALLEVYK